MRIISGRFRGAQLTDVGKGDQQAHLRPTTDRVREALFNLLAHGGYRTPPVPQDMRVLDLFAGTGALGLEALSRGAAEVMLVDNGKAALTLQRSNIKRLSAENIRSLRADALDLPKWEDDPFDLVFLDPPYGQNLAQLAIDSACANDWISNRALVVLEESSQIETISGFRRLDARQYAETWVHIFHRI